MHQRNRALDTLAATTRNANELAIHVATKVRRTVGIPVEIQRQILEGTGKLQEQLLGSWQSSVELRRSQAIVHRELAQTFRLLGNREAALAHAEQSRSVMEALLARPSWTRMVWGPGSSDAALTRELRRELSRSYNRIGEVHALLGGDHKRALKAYAAALKIRQELAAGSPGDALQRELALSHERTGDAYLALGYPGPARGHYDQGFAIREKLVLAAPDNTEWQGDLAYSYDRQGRTEPEGEQSLQAFERSAEIREGLVCTEPQDVFWLRDLATSYDQVGDKLRQLERDDERLEYLRKSVAARETLAQRNPDVASQVALARSLTVGSWPGLGRLLRTTGHVGIARLFPWCARRDRFDHNWIYEGSAALER
jgi:tetratricopeptide (TPR) repeat protein